MSGVHAPPPSTAVAAAPPACRNCARFDGGRGELERATPGFAILGSGYAALHAGDGICRRHARYVAADAVCTDFEAG